jgi:hypothetical protein
MTESSVLEPDCLAQELPLEESQSKKPHFDRSITEGPLGRAVWKIAWPTILTNIVAGLQGMVDQVLVGNLVGYQANAAIGVSWHARFLQGKWRNIAVDIETTAA